MVEPAVCVPIAKETNPAATAAAEPLEEPPGVRRGSCGLRVGPGTGMPKRGARRLAEHDGAACRSSVHDPGVTARDGGIGQIRVAATGGEVRVAMMSFMPIRAPASGPADGPQVRGGRRGYRRRRRPECRVRVRRMRQAAHPSARNPGAKIRCHGSGTGRSSSGAYCWQPKMSGSPGLPLGTVR